MSTLAPPAQPAALADAGETAAPAVVPWYLWAVSFASTSVIVGGLWDISWHRTIGRDSFWTPAHLAIYLGGVVAGLSCGWLVLRTTFAGAPRGRDRRVRRRGRGGGRFLTAGDPAPVLTRCRAGSTTG